jgi:ribosome-binding protein aMBF1 (putative translation factor)
MQRQEKQSQRIVREFLPGEQEQWEETVAKVEAELPEIIERDRLTQEAMKEPTVSGQLRCAICASQLSYTKLAAKTKVDVITISEFMCGRGTLDSDVFSRLAEVCKLQLTTIL